MRQATRKLCFLVKTVSSIPYEGNMVARAQLILRESIFGKTNKVHLQCEEEKLEATFEEDALDLPIAFEGPEAHNPHLTLPGSLLSLPLMQSLLVG